jgi:hypothetical protein
LVAPYHNSGPLDLVPKLLPALAGEQERRRLLCLKLDEIAQTPFDGYLGCFL